MVNIQLPISHIIIKTSKTSSKFQMSSDTSHSLDKKDKTYSNTSPKNEPFQEHFRKGSVIQLGSGDTKKVEDLQTEDFVKSALISSDYSLEHSKLLRLGNLTISIFH